LQWDTAPAVMTDAGNSPSSGRLSLRTSRERVARERLTLASSREAVAQSRLLAISLWFPTTSERTTPPLPAWTRAHGARRRLS
jgi:hypothetical protein